MRSGYFIPQICHELPGKEASCADGLTDWRSEGADGDRPIARFRLWDTTRVRCSETVIKKLSDLISDLHWAPIREELQAYYLQATSDKCPHQITAGELRGGGGTQLQFNIWREGQISVSLGVRSLPERQRSITKHLFQLSKWERGRALQENQYWGPERKHKSSDLGKLKWLSECKITFLYSLCTVCNHCINKIQFQVTAFL